MPHDSKQAVCLEAPCGEAPGQVVACVYGDDAVVRVGNVRVGQCVPVGAHAALSPVAACGPFGNVRQVCRKLRGCEQLLIRQSAFFVCNPSADRCV